MQMGGRRSGTDLPSLFNLPCLRRFYLNAGRLLRRYALSARWSQGRKLAEPWGRRDYRPQYLSPSVDSSVIVVAVFPWSEMRQPPSRRTPSARTSLDVAVGKKFPSTEKISPLPRGNFSRHPCC